MTQEEKARAYDEALERARQFSEHPLQEDSGTIVEYIFPELAESEDERIRNGLIALLKFGLEDGSAIAPGFNETKEQALAWLEKQDTVIKDTISMDVNSETEWDDIDKFLRMNLDGEKVKLLIVREE